jgi:hypothetical protein
LINNQDGLSFDANLNSEESTNSTNLYQTQKESFKENPYRSFSDFVIKIINFKK